MNVWAYVTIRAVAVCAACVAVAYITGSAWSLLGLILIFTSTISDDNDKTKAAGETK